MLFRLCARVLVENGSDHTFDHLRVRTTWTQCATKPWKAPISDTKALKITRKCLFYRAFTVRDVEVASSNLVTSTIKAKMRGNASHFCFDSGYSNLSWFAKQTQVRIPKESRSEAELPCHLDPKIHSRSVFDADLKIKVRARKCLNFEINYDIIILNIDEMRRALWLKRKKNSM